MSRQFRPPQPVVWINGWPAMGKQTVAQCLAQMLGCDRAVLIDDREFTDQLHLPQNAQLGRCVELNRSHRRRAQSLNGRGSTGTGTGTGTVTAMTTSTTMAGGGDGNGNGDGDGDGDDERLQLEEELRQKQEACFRKYVQDPSDPAHADDHASINRIVIFTDCRADDDEGAQGAQRYADAAAAARRPFVPVYVECMPEEHARRSQISDRQYYNVHQTADGSISIVGTAADAAREMQARSDGRLYTFPQDKHPGLYVNVTEQGTHETALEIVSFINAVCEKRTDAVVAMAQAAAQRRPQIVYQG